MKIDKQESRIPKCLESEKMKMSNKNLEKLIVKVVKTTLNKATLLEKAVSLTMALNQLGF